jgi:hypothetical protein
MYPPLHAHQPAHPSKATVCTSSRSTRGCRDKWVHQRAASSVFVRGVVCVWGGGGGMGGGYTPRCTVIRRVGPGTLSSPPTWVTAFTTHRRAVNTSSQNNHLPILVGLWCLALHFSLPWLAIRSSVSVAWASTHLSERPNGWSKERTSSNLNTACDEFRSPKFVRPPSGFFDADSASGRCVGGGGRRCRLHACGVADDAGSRPGSPTTSCCTSS